MRELLSSAGLFDVVVATLWTSVKTLVDMWNLTPTFLPAYYVQDYEPYFYASERVSYAEAHKTYRQVAEIGGLLYCWLVRKFLSQHQVRAVKVPGELSHYLVP